MHPPFAIIPGCIIRRICIIASHYAWCTCRYANLRYRLDQQGLAFISNNLDQVYRSPISYMALSNSKVIIVIHMPIYRRKSMMNLYQYTPMPINNPGGEFYITIEPERSLLAISLESGTFQELEWAELLGCLRTGSFYYCQFNNILKKQATVSCLADMYLEDQRFYNTCDPYAIFHNMSSEMVTQLSNFNFSVFFKESTTLDVDCLNTNITARSYTLQGHHIITLPLGCRAQAGLLDFSPEGSILSNAPEHYILRAMDFNITQLLDITEDDFSSVISDIFNLPTDEVHFTDIRKMLGDIDYIGESNAT